MTYESGKKIPVPLEYWSILYDACSNQAVGFLGVNNPHSADITEYKCDNICDQIQWIADLVHKFEDETAGHITCCSVKNLATHIKYIKTLKSRNGRKIFIADPMTEYLNDTTVRLNTLNCD